MSAAPPLTPKQLFAKQFLRVTTILYVLLLLPSVGLALSTIHLFDQPGALLNRGYWFMGIAGLTAPLVLIGAIFGSRSLYKETAYKQAVRVALLPLFTVVLYAFGALLSRLF